MNERFQELMDQLQEIWGKFSTQQKIIVSVVPIFMVIALVFFVSISSRTQMGVLYSNLRGDDAGLIVQKLRDEKIKYELADGKTILVPKEVVYETRLNMASAGLPQGGGVGFEIFDKNKMGVTDFIQQVNYQRALQGELARTIMQIEEIDQVRIHLVIPQPELFVEEEKPATASVVIKFKPFKKLTLSQVKGVVHLLTTSVEGLRAENVTLIDIHGNILNEELQGDTDSKLTATQFEYQQTLEKEAEKKAESILRKVLGPNKAIVKVSAELDFDRSEIKKTTYAPEGTIRSEQNKKEEFEGIKETAAGVPGTESNIPGYQTVEQGAPSRYKKDENIANYEISTEHKTVVESTGDIIRLTIAAIIDGKRNLLESGQEEYVPLTFEEIRKYTNIIKNAVGFKEARGDQISVENIPFDVSYLAKEEKAMRDVLSQDFRNSLIRNITLVILILGSGFIIFFTMYRREERVAEMQISPEQEALPLEEISLETAPESAEAKKAELIKEEIVKLAHNNPENTAKLLKGWLSQED